MRPLSACIACRDRRKKCDRSRPGISCKFCIRRGIECRVDQPAIATEASAGCYEPLSSRQDDSDRHFSSLATPDPNLCEKLVELYFRHVHIVFHNLFHRPTFLARVKDGTIPKILFFGVVSLSARYSSHPALAGIPPWERGRPYRDETKRLLDLNDTSLTTIQACMLLVANASAEGEASTESVYHAVACRMAMLLDLPTLPTGSVLEQEINRRVWWSLITTDTWCSAALSLPRSIKPRDTVPMPMDELSFAGLNYDTQTIDDPSMNVTSPSSDAPNSLLSQMIRLNGLLYEIILLNAKVVAEQLSEADIHDMVSHLARSLDGWIHALPGRLQYCDPNASLWIEQGLGPIFITMHINYNHAGQLLFYQYLHFTQDLDHNAPGTNATEVFARKCKQHATNLCDLIDRSRQRPETVVSYPLAGHVLCLASTVQIHTLLFDVDDDEILASKTRLQNNFEIITSIHQYWPIAHVSIDRLQVFHNACLQDKDDSFQLDRWMLRFMLEFTRSVGDRRTEWTHEKSSLGSFDHLRNLLDM